VSVPRPIRRVSARRTRAAVRSGLDQLLARPRLVRGLRLGLIANPTAVTADLVHAAAAHILCGTPAVRRTIDKGQSPRRLAHRWRREQQAFRRRRALYLLY
jgi:uncharacterized protein YbbC (DUF1343 family)